MPKKLKVIDCPSCLGTGEDTSEHIRNDSCLSCKGSGKLVLTVTQEEYDKCMKKHYN